jgi:hypothetical protein
MYTEADPESCGKGSSKALEYCQMGVFPKWGGWDQKREGGESRRDQYLRPQPHNPD